MSDIKAEAVAVPNCAWSQDSAPITGAVRYDAVHPTTGVTLSFCSESHAARWAAENNAPIDITMVAQS